VSGEAHFQVVKDFSRPFVVAAGGMEVRAVGTAFVVKLGAEQVDVLVTEGRVAVEKPAPLPDAIAVSPSPISCPPSPVPCPASPSFDVAASEAVLVAMLGVRERIVVETAPLAAAPVVMPVTPAEINEHLAWRVSRLEFSATPLAEAVALINRHSQLPDGSANARIVLDESLSGLRDEPVSGLFHASDIASFVEVLGVSMGIESKRLGEEIVLLKGKK